MLFILLPNIQMPTINTLNSFNDNAEAVSIKKNRKKWLWLAGLALLTILSAKTAIWQNDSNFNIRWGFWVLNCAFTPVSWWITSDETTYTWYLNIGHKSWFGGTFSRLDNSWKSAWSRFSKLWVTFNKNIGLPENWNIYLKGDLSYVDFDNTFVGNNGETLNLNELMCVAEIDFKKWEKYFLNLSYLYNAFLNWETPHNMVTKLKAGVNLSKNTTLYSDLWCKHVVNGQNNLSIWIWIDQKLWKWFVVWTEVVFREVLKADGNSKVVIWLRKDF